MIEYLGDLNIVDESFDNKSGFIENATLRKRNHGHESDVGTSSVIDIIIEEYDNTPIQIHEDRQKQKNNVEILKTLLTTL